MIISNGKELVVEAENSLKQAVFSQAIFFFNRLPTDSKR